MKLFGAQRFRDDDDNAPVLMLMLMRMETVSRNKDTEEAADEDEDWQYRREQGWGWGCRYGRGWNDDDDYTLTMTTVSLPVSPRFGFLHAKRGGDWQWHKMRTSFIETERLRPRRTYGNMLSATSGFGGGACLFQTKPLFFSV